jgi:hypothetical protein
MGENATAAIVAVSLFGALASLAFSINAIARAWVARGRDEARLASEPSAQLTDARLVRLEQAVDDNRPRNRAHVGSTAIHGEAPERPGPGRANAGKKTAFIRYSHLIADGANFNGIGRKPRRHR